MEDRYLCKAKRTDNGEWIIGGLVRYGFTGREKYYIVPNYASDLYALEIDPSTICWCTGLRDKTGELIWENDIVSFEDTGEEGYEYKEEFDFVNKAKVEFAEGRWSLTDFASDNSGVMAEMYDHAEFMEFWQYCEVIGNVFDNPELLEV